MSIMLYKREIYLSILSLLLSILLLLLFFMYKNYRYIVQRQKSSHDPFCRSVSAALENAPLLLQPPLLLLLIVDHALDMCVAHGGSIRNVYYSILYSFVCKINSRIRLLGNVIDSNVCRFKRLQPFACAHASP